MADIGRLKERINRFLEQWHRQREAAAKKEQMISDTYTNLSHDIRTPLTSLDGYFQLLKDETDKSGAGALYRYYPGAHHKPQGYA